MITVQAIQTSIDEFRDCTGADIGVYEADGRFVASAGDISGIRSEWITNFADAEADNLHVGGYYLARAMDGRELLYIVAVGGAETEARTLAKIAASQLKNLAIAYKNKFDQSNFIRNLLLDNLLLVDIYNRARKLHIETDCPRAVFVVETGGHDKEIATELMKGMFTYIAGDFVANVDESCIVLVKSLKKGAAFEELAKIADLISDMMEAEAMIKARVAYGTIVNELKDVSKSYKEAGMALEVGKIFYPDKDVIAYSALGVGRLIYQLPVGLCRAFLEEVFEEGKIPKEVDEETLNMVNKFFENNLNISETSRQLFVHRNTLVYRLDKLQKDMGLDVRRFDDALIFKIALMVSDYLDYIE